MTNSNKIKKMTILTFMLAMIVVLQVVATYINFGFPITLTLVPIVVLGATYGVGMGALGGLVFGAVVDIMVVTGADPGGAALFAIHPVVIMLMCIIKGVMAGVCSALVYKLFRNKNSKIDIILAAVVAPIVNTGIFYLCLIIFFDYDFSILFGAFISVNFLIELLTNVILAPGLDILVEKYKE